MRILPLNPAALPCDPISLTLAKATIELARHARIQGMARQLLATDPGYPVQHADGEPTHRLMIDTNATCAGFIGAGHQFGAAARAVLYAATKLQTLEDAVAADLVAADSDGASVDSSS